MEIFYLTLKQMLTMFTLILVCFLLRKASKLPENSANVMSKMEMYIFLPALSLYTQMTKCTVQTFAENASLILYGLLIVLSAILLSYPLSRLFVKNSNSSPALSYQKKYFNMH